MAKYASPEKDKVFIDICDCPDCKSVLKTYPYKFGPVTKYIQSALQNNLIIVSPTVSCNAHCEHCVCHIKYKEGFRDILSKEAIDKLFGFIEDDPVILITGGEPFLYPELSKYIADKAHEKGLLVVLGTNGFFGENEELVNFLLEMKPEIILLSTDRFHQKFVSINTIKSLINKIYGEIEIIIKTCLNESDVGVISSFDDLEYKLSLERDLNLKNKKIFYSINRRSDLEPFICEPNLCSSCGFKLSPTKLIGINCRMNLTQDSSFMEKECREWEKNIFEISSFDFKKIKDFLKPKRLWINIQSINEIQLLANSERFQ